MGTFGWGMVMMIGLMLLCVGIIIIACFYAVWLVRLVHSVLTKKPVPLPPFNKNKGKSARLQ